MVRFILLASPRTGSTWLLEMLMRNQEIKMAGELLNLSDKRNKIPKGGTEAVLSYVNQKLNQLKGNVVGFKVFPSQLIELNINLADLMDFIGASYLLILWRKSVLETCWSYQMAMKTQIWYTGKKNAEEAATAEQMVLSAETIEKYLAEFTNHWETIATQVPRETLKLFVMYENLLTDTKYELSRIFDFLRIPVKGVVVRSNAVRQHPSSIEQKMPNYKQLPQRLRDAIVDVPQIFSNAVLSAIENPKTIQFLPSLEPNNPAGGWRYTVTKPLITTKMKENVLDALDTEMISSEGPWPKVMASKLRNWYQVTFQR